MNGDTLEFNPAAFKLDTNAVAEDLLRKLPGVIVWGDGTITVNGKEIKSLLVNGKPFFGGATTVASQNIPKNIINKVQVYRTDFNPDNPLDTITVVNLQLMKDKQFGYFGKIGGGYGTDSRFEGDVNMNFFSRSVQVGLAVANNNINKEAENVSTLLKNSTFKGVGANTDYMPNFKANGISNSKNGGFTLQKDFEPEPNKYKSNRLTANYFIRNLNNNTFNNANSRIVLGDNITQIGASVMNTKVRGTDQDFSSRYEKKVRNLNFFFETGLKTSENILEKNQRDSVASIDQGLQSLRNLLNRNNSNTQNFSFKSHFGSVRSLEKNRSLSDWTIDYIFLTGKQNEEITSSSVFTSVLTPSSSRNFNRFNDKSSDYIKQEANLKVGDFYRWLSGRTLNGINVNIQNGIKVIKETSLNQIYDRVSNNLEKLIFIPDLSSNQQTNIIDERPSLNFNKNIMKVLSGRYQKSLNINAMIEGQFYRLKNSSDRSFQNFDYTYSKFIPKGNISYSMYRPSEYNLDLILNYSLTYNYPTPNQLYPVVDYSGIYNVQLGNSDLKPSEQQEISAELSRNSLKSKNTFKYTLSTRIGRINDNFSYSFKNEADGSSTYSFVNLDGYKYFYMNGLMSKAFKFKKNQLQFKFNANLSIAQTPGYVKSFTQIVPELNFSHNFNTSSSLQVYYSYSDVFAINLNQIVNTYSSRQSSSTGDTFKSNLITTSVAGDAKVYKKLSLGTNIDYNIASFTSAPKNNFLLWNVTTNYRFMKGNNLEVKLSALDILRQNKNIITFASNNVFRQTQVNALQQYFMFSLAYYPRKFGRKN
jgi:hypothetical protein